MFMNAIADPSGSGKKVTPVRNVPLQGAWARPHRSLTTPRRKIRHVDVASITKDNGVTDDSYSVYKPINPQHKYVQLKMAAENFALLSPIRPFYGFHLANLRRRTISSFFYAVNELLKYKVVFKTEEQSTSPERWADVIDESEASNTLYISSVGDDAAPFEFLDEQSTILTLLGADLSLSAFKVLNAEGVVKHWLMNNCTNTYNVDVNLRIYKWLCTIIPAYKRSECYLPDHNIIDFENSNLASYASEAFSGEKFRYPTSSATVNGSVKICSCGANLWSHICELLPVKKGSADPEQPLHMREFDVDGLNEQYQQKYPTAEKGVLVRHMLGRLEAALEFEFFLAKIQKGITTDGYVDVSDRTMTGIDLGLAVKACSDEIAAIANIFGLRASVNTISHHGNQKLSLAIVIQKIRDDSSGVSLPVGEIKSFISHSFPLLKAVFNTSGVYDLSLLSKENRVRTATNVNLSEHQLAPLAMNMLYKSTFTTNTNVNANIMIEMRTWYKIHGYIFYDQEIAACYGVAMGNVIMENLKNSTKSLKIKADKLSPSVITNSELRIFLNFNDVIDRNNESLNSLAAEMEEILKLPSFHVDVLASLLRSISTGSTTIERIQHTNYYFSAVLKCKRIEVMSGIQRKLQDVYVLPLKIIDMGNEDVRNQLQKVVKPTVDGVEYSALSTDDKGDVTEDVIAVLLSAEN